MKKFLAGLMAGIILMTCSTVFAETRQTIDAIFGQIKLVVDGKPVDKETLLYNGTTYVPLRAAAEALGKEVAYDDASKTAYIDAVGTNRQIAKAEVKEAAKEAAKEEPAAGTEQPNAKGSRKNPYGLNEPVVVGLLNSKIEITFLEAVRGAKAYDMAVQAYSNTKLPSSNEEFYLAKVRFKVLSNDKDEAVSSIEYGFRFYGSDGVQLEYQSSVGLEPQFASRMFPGGQTEGWLKSIVPKNDDITIEYYQDHYNQFCFNLNVKGSGENTQSTNTPAAASGKIVYYKEHKTVPDFGAIFEVKLYITGETQDGLSRYYSYKFEDINTESVVSKYVDILENEGFTYTHLDSSYRSSVGDILIGYEKGDMLIAIGSPDELALFVVYIISP